MTTPHLASDYVAAATLVIFRQSAGEAPQLLMVERARAMRFAAGAAVFPGGRVDPADAALARQLGAADGDALEETTARIAAIRETLEETGLAIGCDRQFSASAAALARQILQEQGNLLPVLAHFGCGLDLAALTPYARWRQPHVGGFDTRFYLANLGTGAVDIAVDATENELLYWISASDALAKADAGELAVIFPTRRNLERLAQHRNFAEARADALAHPVVPITARREWREGEEWLMVPEGLGYPVLGEPLAQVRRG